MCEVTLSNDQLNKIKSLLAEEHDTNGKFCVDIEVGDGFTVTAEGYVEIGGYVEDDYLNGTGGFVETSRNASVELVGWQYNHLSEDEEEVEIDPVSVKVINDFLNAA